MVPFGEGLGVRQNSCGLALVEARGQCLDIKALSKALSKVLS